MRLAAPGSILKDGRGSSWMAATSPFDRDPSRPLSFGQAGLLVDADQVSGGVTKGCDHLAGTRINWIHYLAAGRDDRFGSRGSARNHDVNHQSGLSRRRPAEHPCAADLVDGIVKRGRPVTSLSDV